MTIYLEMETGECFDIWFEDETASDAVIEAWIYETYPMTTTFEIYRD